MWAGDNRDMICTLLILGRARISSVPRPTQQIVRYHMQKVSVRMLNFAINSYTNFCWISQASDRMGVLIQPHVSAIHTYLDVDSPFFLVVNLLGMLRLR